MIFKHGEGDKVVLYKRNGFCRHCGGCCDVNCDAFSWMVLIDLTKGQIIKSGEDLGNIRSKCDIYDCETRIAGCTKDARQMFPMDPFSTPRNCGFYWVVQQIPTL